MPTPISYHSGARGVLGFLKYITGADGVVRGGVVPAFSLADSDGNADPTLSTSTKGSAAIASGQIAVTTSATQVVPARSGRQAVTITSTSAVVFYVGAAGVTAANGHYVAAAAGASITIPTAAAVFAIGSAAVTVSFLETF